MKEDADGSVNQFIGLDVVRFLAALMVVAFHLTAWSWMAPTGDLLRLLGPGIAFPHISKITLWGWCGVEVFFVLSGFVIALSLNKRSFVGFFRGRVRRLLPCASICSIISMAVLVLSGNLDFPHAAVRFLRSVIFFPTGPYIDGAYWTLAIEISFYFFMAVTVLLIKGLGRFLPCYFMGAISSIFCVTCLALGHFDGLILSRASMLLLLTHGCLFALGVLMYDVFESGIRVISLILFSVFFVGVCAETYISGHNKIADMGVYEDPSIGVLIVLSLIFIMMLFVALNRHIHKMTNIGFRSIVRFLGILTYPLYLLHSAVGTVIIHALAWIGVGHILALLVACSTVLVTAIIISVYIEPRALELFERVEKLILNELMPPRRG